MMRQKEFEALYRSEVKRVYGFLRRLGARGPELEDLTHDVFVTAMRRWSTYDPSRAVGPWLLGIAFRCHVAARRSARTEVEVAQSLVDPAASPEANAVRQQAQQLLERALASLPESRRDVFVLHELEGVTGPDLAAMLDVPLATAYSRIRLAREDMNAAVKRLRAADRGGEGS